MNEKSDLNLPKPKRASLPVRLMRKPFSYQCLIAEALIWLGITRFVIRYLPFRFLMHLMGDQAEKSEHAFVDQSGTDHIIKEIPKAVVTISRRVPWECKCLVQASAAKIMLNKRGVSSVICLGVSKSGIKGKSNTDLDSPETEDSSRRLNMSVSGRRKLRPHAWLIAGGEVILGGENLSDYVTVSRF